MGFADTFLKWIAPKPAKSWPLENQVQAQAFAGILKEEGISFRVRRHGEALWGYAEQAQEGWGHLEVDPSEWDRVDQLFQDFVVSTPSSVDEPEPGI